MRDALTLLDQAIAFAKDPNAITEVEVRTVLGQADRGRVADLVDAILDRDPESTLARFDEMVASGQDLVILAGQVLQHLARSDGHETVQGTPGLRGLHADRAGAFGGPVRKSRCGRAGAALRSLHAGGGHTGRLPGPATRVGDGVVGPGPGRAPDLTCRAHRPCGRTRWRIERRARFQRLGGSWRGSSGARVLCTAQRQRPSPRRQWGTRDPKSRCRDAGPLDPDSGAPRRAPRCRPADPTGRPLPPRPHPRSPPSRPAT